MKKKSINRLSITVVLTIFASTAILTSAFGQEKFNVTGEINFHEEKGQFLLMLKNHEQYDKRIPAQPERNLVIKPNPQQLQAKKVAFKFSGVPNGEYCIVCIHDLNMNGKLDYPEGATPGSAPPIEPYAYSGPKFQIIASWFDIKFKVDKDVSDIEIKF